MNLRRHLVPYLYIAPAFALTLVFSFVSMGISLYASFHHFDAFAGASSFVFVLLHLAAAAPHQPATHGTHLRYSFYLY